MLCNGYLPSISVLPMFHQIDPHLNSTEFCKCTFRTVQLICFLTCLSALCLPCKSPPIKKKKIIKIWTVSNYCHCLYVNNLPEKSYFLHCLCLLLIANVISFSTAETLLYWPGEQRRNNALVSERKIE